MEQATYIYALTDPMTEEVRYIGKTIHDPLDRLKSHIGNAQMGRRSYKNSWIKGLLSLGLEPDISVLEIVFYPESWQEREKWWIAFAKEQQCRLTNLCDGGEGVQLFGEDNPFYGHKHTEEAKRKISDANKGRRSRLGCKHSEETKRRISVTKKGKPGHRHTEEAKRKISKANRGRRRSKEARQKNGETHAKPYPAFINEVTGEIIPAGVNLNALCRKVGLGNGYMGAVKNRRQRSYRGWVLLEEKG